MEELWVDLTFLGLSSCTYETLMNMRADQIERVVERVKVYEQQKIDEYNDVKSKYGK